MHASRSRTILKSRQRFSFIRFIALALRAFRQRRQLSKLDNRRLRDIGVTREEAAKEAGRHVWDVPHTWLK